MARLVSIQNKIQNTIYTQLNKQSREKITWIDNAQATSTKLSACLHKDRNINGFCCCCCIFSLVLRHYTFIPISYSTLNINWNILFITTCVLRIISTILATISTYSSIFVSLFRSLFHSHNHAAFPYIMCVRWSP